MLCGKLIIISEHIIAVSIPNRVLGALRHFLLFRECLTDVVDVSIPNRVLGALRHHRNIRLIREDLFQSLIGF